MARCTVGTVRQLCKLGKESIICRLASFCSVCDRASTSLNGGISHWSFWIMRKDTVYTTLVDKYCFYEHKALRYTHLFFIFFLPFLLAFEPNHNKLGDLARTYLIHYFSSFLPFLPLAVQSLFPYMTYRLEALY